MIMRSIMLTGQRQDIALLLILLLVFPLAGQSLHIIIHHHYPAHRPQDQLAGSGLCKRFDPCPICQFEFTTLTTLKDKASAHPDNAREGYNLHFIPVVYSGFSGTDINLRAPPSIG